MPNTAVKYDETQVTNIAETAFEDQKQEFVDEFKGRLKNSIEKGLDQVEKGQCAPFDDDYKQSLRSAV